MSTSVLPPLPLITGDLILETFSHKSLNLDYDADMSTDNQRLIELGRTMLEFAATRYLYLKRPIVASSDIPAARDDILSSEIYNTWVSHYNLRQRLRYIPSDTLDITNADETRQLFQAYVGAVVAQSGPHVATNWITQLVDPEAVIASSSDESHETEEHRASKRPRSQPAPPETTPPPVPTGPPPPITAAHTANPSHYGTAQVTNGSSVATTDSILGPQATLNKVAAKFLPAFNERCSKQHLQVEYQAANHASSHAPLWVIKCLVNGIQKGEGQGSSKQTAKEAAAKQAYYAMGWAAYGLPS